MDCVSVVGAAMPVAQAGALAVYASNSTACSGFEAGATSLNDQVRSPPIERCLKLHSDRQASVVRHTACTSVLRSATLPCPGRQLRPMRRHCQWPLLWFRH